MSLRRTFEVFRLDFKHYLSRPIIWMLLVLLALTAWGLAAGNVRISSGDSDVGGTKAWITSQFAVANLLAVLILLYYAFFLAVGAGMIVIRDDELKVGELLHSTALSPGEYVWGKFLAVLSVFFGVLALHVGFHAFANHVLAGADSAEYIGPFALANYIRPGIIFGVPAIVFIAGMSFAFGEWTRRPILVFALPAALMLLCGFFLWDWSPSWLDPRINRALMLIDPAGARWLNETWLKVDRGVAFYNHEPIGLDEGFILSRLGFIALGLSAVVFSQRHIAASLRGSTRNAAKRALASRVSPQAQALVLGASGETRPLSELRMTNQPPGFARGTLEVARVELRELKSQPGLYLFVPLILLQTLTTALVRVGPFDTPLLSTSGTLAIASMNTLTLLVCLLLLFYTVESLERERGRGLGAIYYATPVRSLSILLGKTLANSLVGVAILCAALLADWVVLLVQGRIGLELRPFLVTWGALLVPTFIVWSSFAAFVFAVTGSRFTTYGIGLAALIFTGYMQFRGHMNWVGNWDLWNAVVWSDMGTFELARGSLVLNRAFYLSLALLFAILAVRFFPRRSLDSATTIDRLRPRVLARAALRLAPFVIVPLTLGIITFVQVRAGFQGSTSEKQAKDYWRKNIATWKDAPLPAIAAVDLDLELEPQRNWFSAKGSYTLVNEKSFALKSFPVTAGFHFERLDEPANSTPGANDDAQSSPRASDAAQSTPRTSDEPQSTPSAGDESQSTTNAKNATNAKGSADAKPVTDRPAPKAESHPTLVRAKRDAKPSNVAWTLDGEPVEPENRAGLYVFTPKEPLQPGAKLVLGFQHGGTFPKGSTKNGGGTSEFILPSGVVLTSFSPSFVPTLGYTHDIGVDEDNHSDAKEYADDFYEGITESDFGSNTPFTTHLRIHAPEEYTINSVGTLTSDTVANGVRTVVWDSDHPVHFFNVVAGRWNVRRGEGTAIYYHPTHTYNVDEMLLALNGARRWYSEWFRPFPWSELKLSEFPALDTYAQGFPTDITFSEGIGFLTKSDPRAQAAFMITAHESAHQWWGNILVPGKGPGGNILSEGMSHFSTVLLIDQVLGLHERIEFCKRIESRYGDSRQVDSERPLVKIDGSRPGDTTVTYDKSGWVFWMLLNHIGRDNALAGLRAFIKQYENGPDHPVLQDFVASMRPFAPDVATYDEFVQQWFFHVNVPQYTLTAERTKLEPDAKPSDAVAEAWDVKVHIENTGTGQMPIELAAIRGERFPEVDAVSAATSRASGSSSGSASALASEVVAAEPSVKDPASTTDTKQPAADYREQRTTVTLGPGQSQDVTLHCDFEPTSVLVDPDALVLQLQRKLAIVRF